MKIVKTKKIKKFNKSKFGKKLDIAWSLAVKKRAGYKCEVCGKTDTLNSHHIVGRRNHTVRWELDNGVCLCVSHHKFGLQSAHEDSPWFTEWLKENKPNEYKHIEAIKYDYIKWDEWNMQDKLTELQDTNED